MSVGPRRLAKVSIEQSVLISMLRGHPMSELVSDWPDVAQVIDVAFDPAWGHVILTIESPDFAELLEGSAIPNWTPMYTGRVTLASEWLKVIKSGVEADGTWPLT